MRHTRTVNTHANSGSDWESPPWEPTNAQLGRPADSVSTGQPSGYYRADQSGQAGVPALRNPSAPPVAPAPQGAYGAYGVTITSVRHPAALPSLTLGIIGLVFSPILLGILPAIVAVIMSRKTHAEIDGSQGRFSGRGLATAGFTMAIIGLTLSALLILVLVGSLTS